MKGQAIEPEVIPVRINDRELLTTIDHTRIQRLPIQTEIKTLIDRGWIDVRAMEKAAPSCHMARASLRYIYQRSGTALATYRRLFPEDRIDNPHPPAPDSPEPSPSP